MPFLSIVLMGVSLTKIFAIAVVCCGESVQNYTFFVVAANLAEIRARSDWSDPSDMSEFSARSEQLFILKCLYVVISSHKIIEFP